jgi:hypothetical protein
MGWIKQQQHPKNPFNRNYLSIFLSHSISVENARCDREYHGRRMEIAKKGCEDIFSSLSKEAVSN